MKPGIRALSAAILLLSLTVTTAARGRQGEAPSRAVQPVQAATDRTASRLHRIFDLDDEREQDLDPLSQLVRGEDADAHELARLFTDSLDRDRLASARQSLDALAAIDASKLSQDDRISLDAFRFEKREEIAMLRPEIRALTGAMPLTHFGGLQVDFPTLMASGGAVPYANEEDYRQALALLGVFPKVLDNAMARFRQGLASGIVEPRLTVDIMIAQIDALLAQPVENSPFMSPVYAFPDAIPAARRPALRDAFIRTTRDRIYPAYRRLRAFLHDEYLPGARETVGLNGMKGGPALYRQLIVEETTLPLDPDKVHALGLSEVARIQSEMDKVRAELGYKGSLRSFFDEIRRNPRYHPRTATDLERGYATIGHEVDAQIPRFFAQVPKAPLRIETYPAYRARYEAGGSYSEGSPDGTRPGIFWFNTYDLPSRFLTGMTTLYLHEGTPGHHFQISLAQENESLPSFQRFGGNDAFVEGWALYAETLGYSMGLYKDPMQHWGTLDDEMLRAMRLVVDTGIHAQGWSRDRAIAYMLDNSGMGRSDAEAEVDRYISIPAQALSYKIGALTIQRLEDKAKAALGTRFDIRAFHEQVLGSGALPLPVLETKIDGWIAKGGGLD